MRRVTLAILISLVVLMFALSGCAKKECEVASDCGSNTKCITYRCGMENTCFKDVKPSCCGNAKCEADSGENSCNCNDCGSCAKQGKVQYNVTSTRGIKTLESKFASYVCENNECVVGVSPDLVTNLKLTSLYEERSFFQLEVLNTLNSPYNVKNDNYTVRLTLKDLNPAKIAGPLVVTGIQVLNGNYLMAEKLMNVELTKVGQTMNEMLALTSAQTLPEEEASISLKISYSYIPLDYKGNKLPIKRSDIKQVISPTKIMLVQP